MTKIIIFIIKLYQKFPGLHHYSCKFYPTCSNYAIIALEKYGFLKGSALSLKRVIRCNPKTKGGIDFP